MTIPARTFLRACRANMRGPKLADSMGQECTAGETLMRALIFRRLLRREVLDDDEQHVGLLLPPSVGGALANVTLAIDRRVAVNLNYTFTSDLLNYCIEKAGIRHVLTSKKVLEKFDFDLDAELVLLEDVREKLTTTDKLVAAAMAHAMPIGLLERVLGLHKARPDDLLTLIFTSGSTGRPKAAMLTNRNIGSNVEAFCDVLRVGPGDCVLGILPFFHAFGYTTCLWAPLMRDASGAYHTSPLEPRPIGQLIRKYEATVLPTTPTFLRSWLKRSDPEDWRSINSLIAGAEKLPKDLGDQFEKVMGVRPWEGYGTTETSPVVSTNVPPNRTDLSRVEQKIGSIGRPLPGTVAKIVDLETGEDLGPDLRGMLLVKGPHVMKGYLDEPEKTAAVIRDGWYTTGDVATIDRDGFIYITGRESRISKIGGEMVPHILIEEAVARVIEAGEDDDEFDGYRCAVAGVPDEKKGERIVVFHVAMKRTPQEICAALREEDLPALWIPDHRNFHLVDEIPVLGTGKMDLRAVKDMAERLGD